MKKRVLSLLLALVMCLSLAACGSTPAPSATPEPTPEPTATPEPTPEPEPEPTIYNFGDSVTSPSGMFVFTPTFDGFAAALSNWQNKHYLRPEGEGLDDKSKNPYAADEGKVMMYFSGVLEYVGDSKETESFDFSFKVDYDNGYVFSDGTKACSVDESSWDDIATFEPLSSDTSRCVRFCIEVPDKLEKDFEKQTVTVFTIEGEEFTYLVDTKTAAEAKAEREAAEEAERQERMTPVDDDLAAEIKEKIQGTFSWSIPGYVNGKLYSTSHELTFSGDTVSVKTKNTLLNTTLSNTGTYSIAKAYLILDFQDGSQALMPYTYEDGEFTMSSDFEGAFYTA